MPNGLLKRIHFAALVPKLVSVILLGVLFSQGSLLLILWGLCVDRLMLLWGVFWLHTSPGRVRQGLVQSAAYWGVDHA